MQINQKYDINEILVYESLILSASIASKSRNKGFVYHHHRDRAVDCDSRNSPPTVRYVSSTSSLLKDATRSKNHRSI